MHAAGDPESSSEDHGKRDATTSGVRAEDVVSP